MSRRGVGVGTDERTAALPGDELVPDAVVVMDRAMVLPASPDVVWPWLLQLGKHRAGWYLPRTVERFEPAAKRGLRRIDPALQGLGVGDVIPDWGGRDATFEVAVLEPNRCLVHRSQRGDTRLSWALVLRPLPGGRTRLQLRLRVAGVRHRTLVERLGGFVDWLTIVLLAAGLRERVVA